MENSVLYNNEILEKINKNTKIKLNLEIQNTEDEDPDIFEIVLIKFPKLQSYKESNIYENIIEFLSDNYYETILQKTNFKYFVPYDEPKYIFDLQNNIIEITYQHDMRKYNILENYNLNMIEHCLYDNYLMENPFE